ncbi:MAG: hypothetical protein H6632_01955 [Anaerolineales bacterium]|nr:hypothetical protein [Anaerolineales bacterium]
MVKKKAAVIVILLLAGLTIAAFQSPQFQVQTISKPAVALTAVSPPTASPTQTLASIVSPLIGARQWLQALNSSDEEEIQTLTCQAQQESLKESSGLAIAFPSLAKLSPNVTSQLQGTVFGLNLEIIRQDETRARIHIDGNLVVSGSGLMAVYAIDERWWLVYEEGLWRWCGTSQGEATPTLTPTITTTPFPLTRSVRAGGSSSLSLWKILGMILTILAAAARFYNLFQRHQNKKGI